MTYDGNCPIFNIGSGSGLSLNGILIAIEELLGHPVKRTYLAPRTFDVPENVLDISLAAQLLNWHPKVSFPDGLARMKKWMNGNVF